MLRLDLPILRTASDRQSIELYNAVLKMQEEINRIANAKIKPTNNQNNDYYISQEPL